MQSAAYEIATEMLHRCVSVLGESLFRSRTEQLVCVPTATCWQNSKVSKEGVLHV